MPVIRHGNVEDVAAVAAIQNASPEAAQWDPAEYLQHDFRVALCGTHIAGFLVARALAPGEIEILNLAVSPEFRRMGVGRALVASLLGSKDDIFLEVRPSNQAARNLYKSMGFEEVSSRPGYYRDPPESAIVMKFRSC
jgi:ribosomal-protein-alanine N-acetyltransferase